MVEREARPLGAAILVFLVIAGGLLAIQAVRAQPNTVYLNVNQEAVPPGSDVSFYSYGNVDRFELRLVDPFQFIRERTTAIGNGTLLDSLSGATSSSLEPYRSSTRVFHRVPGGLLAVVAIKDGAIVQSDIVQATRVGLLARHGATEDLYWAVSMDSGEPIPNAQLHRAAGPIGTTDAEGLLRAPRKAGPALLLAGSELAVDGGGYASPGSQGTIAITTDRPLFRPGQTVHLKLVSWARDGDSFSGRSGENLSVTVSTYRNGRQEHIGAAHLVTNSFGTASLALVLPTEAPIGYYTVHATSGERTGYGSFQVDAYRLPKFRVEVTPNQAASVVNESHTVLVTAKYYYGEALTRGTVSYTVQGSRFTDCWYRCYDSGWSGSTGPAQKGSVELGADGTARIAVRPTSAGRYMVSVTVKSITGEAIDARATLEAYPAAMKLRLESSRYFFPTNTPSHVDVRLLDLDDAPRNGSVELQLYNQTWKEGSPERSLVGTFSVPVRDGKGRWSHSFQHAGYYVLVASARDEAGRVARTERGLYVGAEPHHWYRSRNLEVLVGADSVDLGDPIPFSVLSMAQRPILVVVEGADPEEAQVVRPGASPRPVIAKGHHAPNARIAAFQVQSAQASSASALLAQDSVSVDVVPHPQRLNVTVRPDRDRYEDGDHARILIEVRDHLGRPVSAEVSVAMVDQALLDLSGRTVVEAFDAFYPKRYGLSGTNSWGYRYQEYLFAAAGATGTGTGTGTVVEEARLMPHEHDDQGSSPPSSLKVREFFPETALWLPHLVTGPDGRLRIDALLPDTLTTWRLRAEAVTADGKLGSGVATLRTGSQTVADLFAPRFLTQGDEATVQATFANYAGVLQDFRLLLNVTGAQIVGDDHRTLTLAHGQSELVSFRLRAPEPGTATLTLYGWSGSPLDAGDAVRLKIPVKPHGVESQVSYGGVNEAHLDVTIPANAVGKASRLNVTLSPTVADALVEALPYLTGFPYGCVEQTLSRFLPDLAVVEAAEAFGLNASKIDPDLDEQVEAGLARLYGYQHSSGAWGWWQTDPDNPYTTAYVVYGLAVARRAGFAVDANVLSRGVEALAKMTDLAPALEAYRAYALSVADASRTVKVPSGSSAAELALGALTAKIHGADALASQKVASLRSLAVTTSAGSTWRDAPTEWGDHGISSGTILTALALRAILAVSPDAPEAHGAARWLLSNREGASWTTTKDTAEAVLSLVEYFRHVGARSDAMDVNVRIDGVDHPIRFEAGTLLQAGRGIEVPVEPGVHRVDITKRGGTILYWGVLGRYWESAEPIRSVPGPFLLTQELLGADGKPTQTLQAGDEATLRITAQGFGSDQRYVMIEAPLPAGVEVVKESSSGAYWWRGSRCGWCGGWSAAEVRDDRVGFFAWSLTVGETRSFEVKVRALFPGSYHVLPVSAEQMYDPTVRGHAEERRLLITDEPGLQVGRVALEPGRLRANIHGVGALPSSLSAWVMQGGSEVDRASFGRHPGEPWTIELDAPTGDFELWLRSGDVTTSRRIQLTPVPVAPSGLFNATHEASWIAGPVLNVTSGLAVAKGSADYDRVFATVPLDPVSAVSAPPRASAGPEALLVVSLFGLVALALLARSRSKP